MGTLAINSYHLYHRLVVEDTFLVVPSPKWEDDFQRQAFFSGGWKLDPPTCCLKRLPRSPQMFTDWSGSLDSKFPKCPENVWVVTVVLSHLLADHWVNQYFIRIPGIDTQNHHALDVATDSTKAQPESGKVILAALKGDAQAQDIVGPALEAEPTCSKQGPMAWALEGWRIKTQPNNRHIYI